MKYGSFDRSMVSQRQPPQPLAPVDGLNRQSRDIKLADKRN